MNLLAYFVYILHVRIVALILVGMKSMISVKYSTSREIPLQGSQLDARTSFYSEVGGY